MPCSLAISFFPGLELQVRKVSSGLFGFLVGGWVSVCPGSVFVVGGVAGEAAVEVADEVGERS